MISEMAHARVSRGQERVPVITEADLARAVIKGPRKLDLSPFWGQLFDRKTHE
jgi:hypothetical protein